MKVVIIGSSGQLGSDLNQNLPSAGIEVLPISGREQLDISNTAALATFLDQYRPDAVINTAAFHNVDLCETEPEMAYRINVIAVRGLAILCQNMAVRLMQIGTDYVMEGEPQRRPLPETAAVNPKSIYALTRFGGDCMTLTHAADMGYVVRTCGLFGMAGCKLKGGLNFVDAIITKARAGQPLLVVNDQVVAPTATDNLANQLVQLLQEKPGPGIYHAVSHGECSWYEFATTALELAGIQHPITAVSSREFAAPACRPGYSVLANTRLQGLGLDIMDDWRTSLKRYIQRKYGRDLGAS